MSTIVSLAIAGVLYSSSSRGGRSARLEGWSGHMLRDARSACSWACGRLSISVAAHDHQSKLRSIRPLQPERFAGFVRRRDLIAELLDQPAHLRDLLGIALGELAAADEQAVFEADAYVAPHHHRLGRERHLETAGAQHRPLIVVPKQLVGGAFHEHQVFHIGPDAAQDSEDELQKDRRLEPAFVDTVSEIVEMPDVIAFMLELGVVALTHQL